MSNLYIHSGERLELSTVNYPRDTYSDSKWIITSSPHAKLIVNFVDFIRSFGVSLTIGWGDTFHRKSKIITVGSKDIPINQNDAVIINQTVIWIWFQTNDPSINLESEHTINLHLAESVLHFDSSPSVPGMKLRLQVISNGTFPGIDLLFETVGVSVKWCT